MSNVMRVFWRDVKRLVHTPAALSVVFFLVLLPSLYSWFNVVAFWDPYDHTDALRICVVNEDDGVDDELLGHLDVGAQVVEQLRGNDQLDWAFVSDEEAIDEVRSGRAYAAFVIPHDFSASIATLTTGEFRQPVLEYHVNEKTGPVAPKITDAGASTLDTTINDTFFSTVSSTVASILDERLDDVGGQLALSKGRALAHVDKALDSLAEARQVIADFGEPIQNAQAKSSAARDTLSQVQNEADAASEQLARLSAQTADANARLARTSTAISTAIDGGTAQAAEVSAQATLALTQTAAAIRSAHAALAPDVSLDDLPQPNFERLIDLLRQIEEQADDDQKARIEDAIAQLQQADRAQSDLTQLVAQLREAAEAAAASPDRVAALAQQALDGARAYREAAAGKAVPAISAGISDIGGAASRLSAALAGQRAVIEQAQATLRQFEDTLALTSDALARTDAVLATLQGDLGTVKSDLSSLASASALDELLGEGDLNPDKIADFMMSPTQVTREELYPINAYGSAMAPLFINLTLWIGVFMLMVIFRLEVDDEGIPNLTITQRTFGRGLLLAIVAALQAAVCCIGCMAIGVQTASAPLFVLTAIAASLSYLAVQYTLSSTLQHVGKALCIILVFVQIPGATGLYPIEMTPDFFHAVYPLFPFTYGINAIRETICGFYGNAWAANIGALAAFMVGFVIIGTIARPYMTNLNRMFARQIEESDIIIGESMQLPARRYRLSQVVMAIADHDKYRDAIGSRVRRFMQLYPRLMRGGAAVGVAFPIVATAVLTAVGVDKVVTLTVWLSWFAVVVGFLLTVEYLRDYLSHLASLQDMSDVEMSALYRDRNRYTRVKPIASVSAEDGEAPDE